MATVRPRTDRAVSYLRTVVPVLWGAAVTWLLTLVVLPTELVDLLTSDLAVSAVTALIVSAWYIAWRGVEAHVPDWLTRIVLGSARSPSYAGRRTGVLRLRDASPESSTTPRDRA